MKKILPLFVFLIYFNAFSQNKSTNYTSSYLYESFEKTRFPPYGWVKKTPNGGTGWARLSPNRPYPGWTYFALPAPFWGGRSYAVASFSSGNSSCSSPGFPNEQWLISPPVIINSGDSLKFKILSCNAYQVDSLDVLLSSTNDSITSFTTTLMSFLSTNFTSTTIWFPFSVNLTPYSGDTIYIAFREHVSDNFNEGDGFSLDMVSVGTPPANDVSVESNIVNPVVKPGYIIPKALFANIGSSTQSFSVNMSISPGNYTSTKTITSLPGGQTYQMFFDTLFTVNNTTYNIITHTMLTGDSDSTNNADTTSVLCYMPDPILHDNRSYFPALFYNIISTKYGGLPNGHNLINVADDFTVPSGSTWTITSIKTEGYSLYTGADIDKFGIYIYDEKNLKPFVIIHSDTVSLPYEKNNADTAQLLILHNPFTLTAGKYWLSVFAVYDTVTQTGNGTWNWFMGANQVGDSCQIENNSGYFFSNFTWESYATFGASFPPNFPALYGKAPFFTIHGTALTSITNDDISKILIYPNPSNNFINIDNAENSNISVYNIIGDKILTEKCSSKHAVIDLSGLPSGSYILKILSDEIVTRKITIIK
jgi:hypothetical protein